MTEKIKFELAKFNLIRQASVYWRNVEKLIEHRGEFSVATWKEMKFMPREKYLPPSYHQRILDQWHRLRQGNGNVTEYITKFDEVVKRCLVDEPETLTVARFRAGLQIDLKRELVLREIFNLKHAYQIARNYEGFKRRPIISKPESIRITTPNLEPEPEPESEPEPEPESKPEPEPEP